MYSTEQNGEKLTTWQSQPKLSEGLGWLIEQITILAEALGEKLTASRLQVYAQELADLSRSQLEQAFSRARRECRFFPTIAELRELAGASKQEHQADVEAQAAFSLVIRHLEREGVNAGVSSLPEPVQYAVRLCGGLYLFNRRLQVHFGDDEHPSEVEDRSYVFLQRDFVTAYKRYPIHEEMLPQLTAQGLLALPQPVRVFLRSGQPATTQKMERSPITAYSFAKKIPEPVTDAQLRDRRDMLSRQADMLLKKGEGKGLVDATEIADEILDCSRPNC